MKNATVNLIGKDPSMALEGGLQEVEGRLRLHRLLWGAYLRGQAVLTTAQ